MEPLEPKPPDPLCFRFNLLSSTHGWSLGITFILPNYCIARQILVGAATIRPSSSCAMVVASAQHSTLSPEPTSVLALTDLPPITVMAAPPPAGHPTPLWTFPVPRLLPFSVPTSAPALYSLQSVIFSAASPPLGHSPPAFSGSQVRISRASFLLILFKSRSFSLRGIFRFVHLQSFYGDLGPNLTPNILKIVLEFCQFLVVSTKFVLDFTCEDGKFCYLVGCKHFILSDDIVYPRFKEMPYSGKAQYTQLFYCLYTKRSQYMKVVVYSSFFSCVSHGYRFTTLFSAVTRSMKLGAMTLSNFGFMLHFANRLRSITWSCQLELFLVYNLSLFMPKGHKDYSLWPKASPLNNLFGSLMSMIWCYRVAFIWNPSDYVPKNTLVILSHFACNFFVHICTTCGCNDVYHWKFMLEFIKYLSWENVETTCKSFPQPSLLRLQTDRLWFHDSLSWML